MTMPNESGNGPAPADADARTNPSRGGPSGRGRSDNDSDFKIPSSVLLQVLKGVVAATDMSEQDAALVTEFVSSLRFPAIHGGDPNIPLTCSFHDWTGLIGFTLWDAETEDDVRQLANLVLSIAFLREASRATDGIVTKDDLDTAWDLIQSVLTNQFLTRPLFSTSRDAQGFVAVPLYILEKDGNIDEMFRLSVWLPDKQQGILDFAIHAHQPSAWSWALAGEWTDHRYVVELVADPTLATHSEYAQSWNDGKNVVIPQTIHQTFAVISNTRKLVCATPTDSAVHTRDMSWSIPAGTYHRTEVLADILHATLSFFDSRRDFVKDACQLGPRDGESFIQSHDFASTRPAALATMVKTVRNWEKCMEGGKQNAEQGNMSQALLSFNSALTLCRYGHIPNAPYYEQLVLSNIESTNTRFGR